MSNLTTLTFKKSFFFFYTLLHASKFPSPQKMSQIPLFSSKRCNAPPFLLSILYKISFLFHVFCFITHVINSFLVVLNIFHTSSKLNAAIFWFSKPFHYIFLLLFRQKAARGVREGFPQAKAAARGVREGLPQAKAAARGVRGRVRGIPQAKAAACGVREGETQDKPTPSDIICQRASLFVSFH